MPIYCSRPWLLCIICLTGLLFQHQAVAQFTRLDPGQTGILFENRLTESEENNVVEYDYFYNGAGVAVGDLNNDGLPDLYFTGNMTPDRLYLNKGNLSFEDVSRAAGVGQGTGWKTGVTFVDINQDGWLDIYVCYSGHGEPEARRNRLYINNHKGKGLTPTFTEEAATYGLDSPAYSTQSVFFDYDKDGDLDCFLLNHNVNHFTRFDPVLSESTRDEFAGDQLFRNDSKVGVPGKFVDISEEAHIKASPLGFGLGVAVADINLDGWPDIYVSNDYMEPDYLYLNNGKPGRAPTFTDHQASAIGHQSYSSMGNDVADLNNDGWPDIITLDMLPADNRRQKLLQSSENYELYQNLIRGGFGHQLMRNMLQLNNGVNRSQTAGTAVPTFSEIGQLAGISNTDWSWAPLVADFDNDGWKDLYVSNGFLRDYTNMDFLKFYADSVMKASHNRPAAMMEMVKKMPSTATKSYIFRNRSGDPQSDTSEGRLTFENKVVEWGFDEPVVASGAICADLDSDGDLDIITSNVNAPARVYRNDSRVASQHFLQIQLGTNSAAPAVGTKVWVYAGGGMQFQEFNPSRGFQSCMYTPLHFGLGNATLADSVRIVWPNNQTQLLRRVKANQQLVVLPTAALTRYQYRVAPKPVYVDAKTDSIPYRHTEDLVNDFKRQPLIPNMLSYQGPHLAQADVNRDGLPDLYAPGAKGQAGVLLLGQKDGSWKKTLQPAFEADRRAEDTDALFFDADGDGDPDLYVVSGGYNELVNSPQLQDRLYLNDGKGRFSRTTDRIPPERVSDACVIALDIDKDGDKDLFIGGRVQPGRYPEPVGSRILVNNGKGLFTDETNRLAPFLVTLGMVTDAIELDVDKDGWPDIVLVGEWMPVTVLRNEQGKRLTAPVVIREAGWWNRLEKADLDGDGDEDLVLGNFGRNCQLKPTEKEPVTLVYADFDQNESIDPFLCYYIQGTSYPMATRDEALNQLFSLRRKFTTYQSYADATLDQILTPEQIQLADTVKAMQFASGILENKGNSVFNWHELPTEAQFAPIYAIAFLDVDGDGRKDLLLGGNQSNARLKIGKMDANYGQLFRNEGACKFTYMPQPTSGFVVKGDVRDILVVGKGRGERILFGRNNNTIQVYRKKQ